MNGEDYLLMVGKEITTFGQNILFFGFLLIPTINKLRDVYL